MAITRANPRIKVDIQVNGVAVQEYEDDEEQTDVNTVTKYVEAVSGADFAVRVHITPPWPKQSMMLRIDLDGKIMKGIALEQHRFKGTTLKHVIAGSDHTKNGQWYLQNFCFSDLSIDESGRRPVGDTLMKDLKEMGEIRVTAFYVKNLRPADSQELELKAPIGLGSVPEKALKGKALSHQSKLRPPKATATGSVSIFDYSDPSKRPFATYIFKYRSRAALQSLLIIPRSPSPVALEDRDVESLSPEEMKELLRRQRERSQATQTVKPERGVKRDYSRARSSTASGAEIDDDEICFVSAKRRRGPITLNEDGIETVDLT